MPYQSFDDRPGGSKSKDKLAKLRLPADLTGKRVLDLGCNEGFFAIEAKRRGAAYVLGIDRSQKAIEAARERAQQQKLDVEFVACDFMKGGDGKFDIILLLSALHYADNPKAVLQRVHNLLAPNGLFILECGIGDQHGRRLRRALRSIDERSFPSLDLLRDDWLEAFSVRSFGRSVPQAGDPMPRSVFHCVRRKPTVVFVYGPGSSGKSSVVRHFSNPLVIETDAIIKPRRNESRATVTKEQQAFDDALAEHDNHIGFAWNAVRSNQEVVSYFANVVSRMITMNALAKLIVVEGVMVRDLAPAIMPKLKDNYVVWNLGPGAPAAEPILDDKAPAPKPAQESATLLARVRSRLMPQQ